VNILEYSRIREDLPRAQNAHVNSARLRDHVVDLRHVCDGREEALLAGVVMSFSCVDL
jgi:hypothetical protein